MNLPIQKRELARIKYAFTKFPGLKDAYRAIASLTNPQYAFHIIDKYINMRLFTSTLNSLQKQRHTYALEIIRLLPKPLQKPVLQKLDRNKLGISGKNCECCGNCFCGRRNSAYPPAMDYRDNYYIPPYEIPVEPNYFPGYNIISMTPRNNYYAPPTWAMAN